MHTNKDTLFKNFGDVSNTDSDSSDNYSIDIKLNYLDKVIKKYQDEEVNFFSFKEEGLNDKLDFDQVFKNDKSKYYGSNTYAQSFTKLKGFVTKINDYYFEANLFDEKIGGTYEHGEFDIADLDQDDLDLFAIGAVFYWTFGYFKINGQIKKMSEIRFQRISILITSEVDDVIDAANKLNESTVWD